MTYVVSSQQLKQIISRIERLEAEKCNILEDIKEVYGEAKGEGFDVPTIKQVIKMRKMDQGKLQEQEALLETYLRAIGSSSENEA